MKSSNGGAVCSCAWERVFVTAAMILMAGGFASAVQAQTNLTATVRHAPSINGRVEGSVWQFLGEGLNFNSGAVITGSLLVPGTPGLNVNGSPTFGGTVTGSGSTSPTGYWITLNSGSTLGNLVTRTDAGTLASVSTPPTSAGTRSVYINSSGDSAGDFSTLKNLTLNGGGVVAVPAGTYDTFTANSGTGFRLGVTNGTTAAVYNFQSLNLNGSADIQVVGPVEIRVKNGFSANGSMGASAHPEWLIIKISNGGFNFNSAYTMYGHLRVPNGTVTINSGCTIVGTVEADRFTVNSNGKLQWATAQGSSNQAPTANAQSVATIEDTAATITLTGSDPENSTLTYTVESGPSHGTLSGTAPNLTYTPATNYFGTDAFTFKVNDGTVDSGTAIVSLTATAMNDAPVLGAIANQTVTEGVALNITNTVADVDSTGFTYALGTNAPTGMAINASTGVISWTTTEAQGPSTNVVSVTVTDDGAPALSDTKSFTVTVLEENSAPVLAAIPGQTVYVGQLLAVTNSATDSDFPANVLAYSLGTNAPPGMTITNGVIMWTPGAGYGNTTNTVSVTVTDDGVPPLSDTKVLVVTVLATNSAPVLAGISNQVVVEGQLLTVYAAASDVDGDALTYSLGTNVAAGMSINATNGIITWTPGEAQGPSTNVVTVVVTDNGSPVLSDTTTFVVTVLEANSMPVLAGITNQMVVEGQLLTVTAVATDSDMPVNGLSYSLGTNAPAGLSINASTGEITWTPGEAQGPGTNMVTVMVVDDGTPELSASTTFTVTVQEDNTAPVITVATNQLVIEGMLLVVTNSATDADVPANGLTFSLGTNAPAGMVINATNGVVTWTPTSAQAPSTNLITVVVTDDGVPPLSANGTFMVTVLATNHAPVFGTMTNSVVHEFQTVGNVAVATDVDGDVLTYSLGTDAPAWMSINATNGFITMLPGELDGGTTNLVTVVVTDNGSPSLSAMMTFMVTVLEGNVAPVLTVPGVVEVVEGQLLLVTGNTVADVDVPANLFTFSLDTNAPAGMTINATNGVISWIPTEAQGPSTNTVLVTVTDNGEPSFSDTKAMLVVVLETNTAPVLSLITNQVVTEFQNLFITNIVAVDVDMPTNKLSFSLGAGAPAGMFIHGTNGNLFWFVQEYQAPSTNLITVIVTDDGTPSLSATQTFTVIALELNERPVFGFIQDQTISEGQMLLVTNTATDVDLPANTLTYTLGTNAPAGMVMNPTNAVITWTPGEEYGGTVMMRVQYFVTDNGSPQETAEGGFWLNILEANEAPILAAIANQTIIEGLTLTITNSVSDSDLPANVLVYSLGTNAPAGMSINATNGTVTWTPTEAQGPSTNLVSVVVTDDGVPSLSATQTFTVAVQETNSVPVLIAPANQIAYEGTLLQVTNVFADADVPANALTFTLGTNAPAGMTINGSNGVISWTPSELQGGMTNAVEVLVVDDGVPSLGTNAFFTVTVLEVNTAPVLAGITNRTVLEGQTLTVTNAATDADIPANMLSYDFASAVPVGMVIDTNTGTITWTPTEEQGPSTNSITVRVTDGGVPALSHTQTFTVTVQEVNAAPVLAEVPDQTVTEGQLLTVTNAVTDTDIPANTFTFTIGTNSPAGMTINATNGVVTWTPSEAQGPSTNLITVIVADNGTPVGRDTNTFVVTVLEANAAPVLAAIPDQTVAEGELLALTATATDADLPANNLIYSLGTGTPVGLLVDANSGAIAWNPSEAQGPSTNVINVIVTDNGVPSLSSTQTFTVFVLETNAAPMLAAPGEQTVFEGQLLVVMNTATDADIPANLLTYALGAGAPAGLVIDANSGTVSWTPTEAQGPSTNVIEVIVTDNGVPPKSTNVFFTVNVLETNSAPVLAALTNQTVIEGQLLSVTNSVTDADIPANAFTFSLGTNAPAGMSINATNGIIAWTPTLSQGPSTNLVTVVVADDGAPSLSATQTFTVFVLNSNSRPVAVPQLLTVNEEGTLTFTLTATDADNDPLTFNITEGPYSGTLSNDGTNYTFTPVTNFSGQTYLVFRAYDGQEESEPATNSITVLPVNDVPWVFNRTNTVMEGQSIHAGLLAYDVDGDAVNLILVSPPFLGTLSGTGTNLTYTASTNSFGLDRFEYQITDGVSTSEVAMVVFDVTPFARSKTWTTSADFSSGTLTNLSQQVANQLEPAIDEKAFNYVWAPIHSSGTVLRLDADTGRVLGEYRTTPQTVANGRPSRTWVDQQGNLWVANEEDNSVVMIATPESGRWVDRNNNGVLDTSIGQGDILAWANGGGVDTNGGTSTAQDELIVYYTKVNGRTIRHLSMNRDGDIWVGGSSVSKFDLIDHLTGQIIRTEQSIGRGGFGGFVNSKGILFSAGKFLRWDTAEPLSGVSPFSWNVQPDGSWNVAEDTDGNIWVTYEPSAFVRKFTPDGTEIGSYSHGGGWGQGMAIDPVTGDVWVAHSHCGDTVGRLKKDGTLVGTVKVASHGPTAVSIDRKGRIWVSSSTGLMQRINPLAGPIGADGVTPVGEVDLTTATLPGQSWAYSHFSGGAQVRGTQRGKWSAVFDSSLTNAAWGTLSWNGLIYNQGNIVVRVSASENGFIFGSSETVAFEGTAPGVRGRYLKVEADFVPAPSGEGPVLYDLTVGTAGYVYTPATQAWTISAGADIEALWPDAVLLKGAIGRSPHTNSINPSVAWSLVSGPGTVTFDNANLIQPQVQFSTNGVYVFRITADNFGDVRTDEVTVDLTPYNRSPWVDAGINLFLRSTNEVLNLSGQVRDDGLPANTPLQVSWRQAFGPGTTLFTDASNAVTQATFTTNGIYILELVADDGEYQPKRKIEVRVGALCTIEEPEGITAWWQANGDGADHINGNQLALPTISFFDQGKVGAAFKFDGTVAHTRAVNSPSLDVGKADGFTVEFWAKPDDLRRVPLLTWHNGTQQGVLVDQFQPSSAYLDCYIFDTNNVSHKISLSGWSAGTWHHAALTYDKTTGVATVYLNGVLNNTLNLGIFEPQTSYDLYLGGNPGAGQVRYKGLLDEVAIYRRALTGQEIYAIFEAGETGKCPKDGNRGPVVDAGPDRVLAGGGNTLILNGYVADDGLPVASTVEALWTKLSGPGNVVFAASNSPVTSVTFDAPGVYLLELSADDSSILLADVVEVRVETLAETVVTNALAVLWPADGHNVDILAGNVAYLAGGASYDTGKVGQGFHFDGANDHAKVFAHQSHDIGDADAFTIELWVNAHAPNRNQQLLSWQTINSQGVSLAIRFNNDFTVSLLDTNNVSHNMGGGGSFFPAGQFVHVAVTYDRISGRGRVYRNGVLVSTSQLGSFRTKTTTDLYLGGNNSGGDAFDGVLDEISLYRRELAAEEIYTIFAAGTRGEARPGINLPPVVNAGPDLVLGSTNAPALLQGTAQDDTMPEGYLIKQWTKLAGPGNVYFAAGDQPVTAVTFDAPGLYILQLAANDGLVEGKDLVQVRVGMECLTCPTGDLKAWWPFNENNRDAIQGLEAAYYNGAGLTNGFVGAALNTANPSSYVRVEPNAAIDIGQMAGYTTEFWVKPSAASGDWTQSRPAVLWHGSAGDGGGIYLYSGIRAVLTTVANTTTVVESGSQLQAGVWKHVATTYDRATGIYRIYVNGILVRSAAVGNITLRTSGQMYLGMHPTQNSHFPGQLDEFAIHGRALDEAEVMNLYLSGAGGKCPADGNAAPVVFAGADFSFTDGLNTTTLQGQVTDDGLPAGINVTSVWRLVHGPGQVAFGTASSPVTTATFSTNGVYVLELSATDGQERSTDLVEVRVNVNCTVGELSGLVGWWPGNGTTRDVLEGMDGIAANGASYTTGKVASAFSFDGANDYVRIPASAGVNIGTNEAFSIEFWFNPGTTAYNSWEGRMVMGWRDGTMLYHYSSFTWNLMQTNGVNHSMTAGGPLSANTWQHVVLTYNSTNGMARMYVNGAERFSQNRGSFTAKTTGDFYLGSHLDQARPYWGGLDEVSMYSRELSVSEIASLYNAGGTGKCPVPRNESPFVFAGANRTHYLPDTATLHGAVYDDGRPVGGTLDIGWTYLSGPGPVVFGVTNTPVTTVEFTQPGVYEFELEAYDGEFIDYDTVTITVLADPRTPPVVALSSPLNPTVVEVAPGGVTSLTVTASASDADGTVTQVELFQGSTSLGVFTNAPYSVALTGVGAGTYAFTAVATDDDGLVTTSAVANAYVYVDNGPPVVEIATPVDATEVTAPTTVTGTASSDLLAYYVLEYRAVSSDNANAWITLSSNTVSVVNGALGALDPTLALNGIYELRLRATDVRNRSAVTDPVSVIFDRNMKIGNFAFSFNDLTIPVAGIPITITRSYDSRNKEMGDFGVGWTMDINNIRLQKNRHLGINWEQTVVPGLFPVYGIKTSKSRVVTITFPSGKTYKFGAVPNPSAQFGLPLIYPKMKFLPYQGTYGTLTPLVEIEGELYPDDQVVYTGDNPGFGPLLSYELLLNPPPGAADNIFFNPDLFEFKTQEGYSYIISETNGLRSVTDPSGNTLTITPEGLIHSAGKSVLFERDTLGRITNIVDAAGNSMQYEYDAEGNLQGYRDREGNVTSFNYDGKHNLLSVVDPRGITPAQNEYDANGRLIRHIDAYGKVVEYTHNIGDRQEVVTDRLGNVTVMEYDGRGNVVASTAPDGGVTISTYDANDNLLTVTDPVGRTMTYTYDADGNRTSVTDPLGNTTSLTYGDKRRVTSVTDPRGNTVSNTFDAKGNLLSMLDPLGNTVTFGYNSKGLPTAMTNALGHVSQWVYDATGYLVQEIDPTGRLNIYTNDIQGNPLSMTTTRTTPSGLQTLTVRFAYDGQNRLTNVVYPDGTSTRTVFNDIGKPAVSIDQLGRQTVREYDELGRVKRVIYADGTSEANAFDVEGRLLATTNRLGQVTQFRYDSVGRMVSSIAPDGSSGTNWFNLAGQVMASTDPRGNSTFFVYDIAGRTVAVTNAVGQVSRTLYDESGNVTNMVDNLGRSTQFLYDELNRRVQTLFADGTAQTTWFDAVGRRVANADQAGQGTWFGYDSGGRLTSVTNALGHVTRYAYDELGQQTAQTDANNHTTTYEYDLMGRRTKRTLPGNQVETYQYDIAGRVLGRTDFNGYTTTYQYDLMSRLLARVPDARLGQAPISFEYNTLGMRTNMTDVSGVTAYEYDNRNRLIKKSNAAGTLHYTYDVNGNVTSTHSENANGVNVTYQYDALNRLERVNDSHNGPTTYTYDGVGNLQGYTYPNGVNSYHEYDVLNRLTNLTSGRVLEAVAGYAYTLGAAGNRLTAQETVVRGGGPTTINRVYNYDALYRLTGESITVSAQTSTVGYTYDAVGNRLTRSSSVPSLPWQNFGYDANDRLTSDTYDANGNTLNGKQGTGQAMGSGYDFEDRLTSATTAAGGVGIVYDGDGNRVRKTVNGVTTWYLVDDLTPTGYAQVVEEHVSSVAQPLGINKVYTYGHNRISVDQVTGNNWTVSFYGYDGHGNVRYLTDEQGEVTDTYDYDAFGNLIARTGTTPNSYLFTGEQYDEELGLYYLRARYHNPDSGRFWSMDSFEGFGSDPASLHKYTYCRNNAVNRIDPSGHTDTTELSFASSIAVRLKFGAIWGILGGTLEGYREVRHGGNYLDGFGRGFAMGFVGGALLGPLPASTWSTPAGRWLLVIFSSLALNSAFNEAQAGNPDLAAIDAMMAFSPMMLNSRQLAKLFEMRFGKDPLKNLRGPARRLDINEGILIGEELGLQTRTQSHFEGVKIGTAGEKETMYLWTIDKRGLNIALETTAFPTPRGNIVHSNISSEAAIAGEAWFTGPGEVTINSNSGRFGMTPEGNGGASLEQYNAAISFWKSLGYKVKPKKFGEK